MIRAAKQFRRRLTLTKHKSKLFFCFLEKPQTALVSFPILPGRARSGLSLRSFVEKKHPFGIEALAVVLLILDSNWNFSGWFDGRESACLELAAIFHLATRRQNSTFFRKLPLFRCKTDKKLLPAPALPWFSCSRKLHCNVQRFWSKAHCAAKWFSGFIVQYLCCESNRLWLMIQDQPHCFCSIESAQHDDRMTWWQPQGDLFAVSSLHQRWQWWRWKKQSWPDDFSFQLFASCLC